MQHGMSAAVVAVHRACLAAAVAVALRLVSIPHPHGHTAVAPLQTGGLGAMKVVKSAAHYTEAARDEITLLSQIAERDPGQACAEGFGLGIKRRPACVAWWVRIMGTSSRHKLRVHLRHVSADVQTLMPSFPPAAEDRHYCCRMIDWFEHAGPHGRHVCMVFEVLGDNLLTLIRWATGGAVCAS